MKFDSPLHEHARFYQFYVSNAIHIEIFNIKTSTESIKNSHGNRAKQKRITTHGQM